MICTNLCRKDLQQNMLGTNLRALETLHIRIFSGNCFDHKSHELDSHLDCLSEKTHGRMVLGKSVGT